MMSEDDRLELLKHRRELAEKEIRDAEVHLGLLRAQIQDATMVLGYIKEYLSRANSILFNNLDGPNVVTTFNTKDGRHLTDGEKAEIRDRFLAGETPYAIANKIGRRLFSVTRYLEREGLRESKSREEAYGTRRSGDVDDVADK